MAASKVMELRSDKGTLAVQLEQASYGSIDIQQPLTLAGWDLVKVFEDYGQRPVVVRSADGDVFIGEVTDVDEDRYVITVELS